MVFQSYALFPHMIGAGERPLRPRRVGDGEARRPTSGRASRSRPSASRASTRVCPRSCRAASSSASPSRGRWCSSPAVLLFDEPLSNLDARLRRQMREEIRDLQQRL